MGDEWHTSAVVAEVWHGTGEKEGQNVRAFQIKPSIRLVDEDIGFKYMYCTTILIEARLIHYVGGWLSLPLDTDFDSFSTATMSDIASHALEARIFDPAL